MEHVSLLPHSTAPATCPYPKPKQISPFPQFSYYSLSYNQVFQVVSFPQFSPPKPCVRLSSLPQVPHACPSHYSWYDQSNNIRCSSTYHKAPRYAVSSTSLLSLRPKYPPKHPTLKHPHPTFLPQCFLEFPSFSSASLSWRHEGQELEAECFCFSLRSSYNRVTDVIWGQIYVTLH